MKRVFLVILVILLIACGGWAFSTLSSYRAAQANQEFNRNVEDLFDALQKFKERLGTYPAGNNAEVVKALKGNNAKGVIIVIGREKNINTKGELVDPWGTPFRFYFAGEGILIRSAGPNRRFDDSTVLNSDDYYRSN
jgi:type II secretory pathway pseudopilin PulG